LTLALTHSLTHSSYPSSILLMKHSPNQFQVEEFNSFIEDNKGACENH